MCIFFRKVWWGRDWGEEESSRSHAYFCYNHTCAVQQPTAQGLLQSKTHLCNHTQKKYMSHQQSDSFNVGSSHPSWFSFLLPGWWGHKASGSLSVLCRVSASSSHPPPQAESVRLWARWGRGGTGGSYPAPGSGNRPELGSGRTRGGGWGLQRGRRVSQRRRTWGPQRYRPGRPKYGQHQYL